MADIEPVDHRSRALGHAFRVISLAKRPQIGKQVRSQPARIDDEIAARLFGGQGLPFEGDSPLYFMLENGLPALREVARLLVRESEPR